jgi:REP element-mobilizing transposase RayT
MDYRYGSHTVFKIQYHFVFVTKYRYKVLKGDVGLKVRELIRQTCEAFEIEILKGVSARIMSMCWCPRRPIWRRAKSRGASRAEVR